MPSYREQFQAAWLAAGGLITPVTAARILDVSPSTISRRDDLKRYQVGEDTFLSLTEVMNRNDIVGRPTMRKPRRHSPPSAR